MKPSEEPYIQGNIVETTWIQADGTHGNITRAGIGLETGDGEGYGEGVYNGGEGNGTGRSMSKDDEYEDRLPFVPIELSIDNIHD